MTRREFLAVAATSVSLLDAWPAFAAEDADLSLHMLLDGFSEERALDARIQALGAFPTAGLSPVARLDRDVVLRGLRSDAVLADMLPFRRDTDSPYTVSPFAGAWRAVDASGPDPALADRIAAETDAIDAAAAQGVILPRMLLERTIASVQGAAGKAPPLVANALWRQCARLVASRSQAGEAPGLWRMPNGERVYAAMLHRQFGGPVSALEAHARLSDEVRRIGGRMNAMLRKQGLTRGSIGERMRQFARQPQWLYSDDDAGRDQAVADMNRCLDRVRPHLPLLFRTIPAEAGRLRVRRMTAAEEAAGRSGYRAMPEDGRDGAYIVDLREIRRRPAWSLPGVVHHELLPGHMMQLLGTNTSGAHPLRARYAPAMAEGWAIYGEELAAETGAFEGDDAALIGHLHWLMFRLCRGMIDTGIHHGRWSAPEARRMLHLMQGEPAYFAGFDKDIDQAIVNPGIRAAEALSWLGLAELGRNFARGGGVRDFHAAALDLGVMPLPLLAERTNDRHERGKGEQ